MSEQLEVFLLMASTYRKSYQLDTINIICYPKDTIYRLRYKKKWIEKSSDFIDKLEKLSKIDLDKQNQSLFLFFNKQQINSSNKNKINYNEAFIPIRWIKIKDITNTETFIQFEIIIDDYFDFEQKKKLINLIKKKYEKWEEKVDKEYNSSIFFVYSLIMQRDLFKILHQEPDKYIWQKICNNLFEINEFKKTIFLILRNIIRCSSNDPLVIEKISRNLLGYKLKPRDYYMIELTQFINPDYFDKIKASKFIINVSLEKIGMVDKEKYIKSGGPYIIYHLIFYTKRSYRKHHGLLGIDTQLLNIEYQKESENEILYPNITVPIKIPFSIRDLILPILFFFIGTIIPIINTLFEFDIFFKISLTLMGSIFVAFALFYLATLKISN